MRLVGGADFPVPGYGELPRQPGYMGQELLDPPSVEGWHTGDEWIDTGGLVERVNFMSGMVGDVDRPGVRSIVDAVRAKRKLTPKAFVDTSLDLMGALEVDKETKRELVNHASAAGDLSGENEDATTSSTQRVLTLLQMIVSAREYSLA